MLHELQLTSNTKVSDIRTCCIESTGIKVLSCEITASSDVKNEGTYGVNPAIIEVMINPWIVATEAIYFVTDRTSSKLFRVRAFDNKI